MRSCTLSLALFGSLTTQTLGFLVPARVRAPVAAPWSSSSRQRAGVVSMSSPFGVDEDTLADRIKQGLLMRYLPQVRDPRNTARSADV